MSVDLYILLMGERERTVWDDLKALSDDEIERIAEADSDNPATIHEDEWAR